MSDNVSGHWPPKPRPAHRAPAATGQTRANGDGGDHPGVSLEARQDPCGAESMRRPGNRQCLLPAPDCQRRDVERGRDLRLGSSLGSRHRHRGEPAPGGVVGFPGEAQVPADRPGPVAFSMIAAAALISVTSTRISGQGA